MASILHTADVQYNIDLTSEQSTGEISYYNIYPAPHII